MTTDLNTGLPVCNNLEDLYESALLLIANAPKFRDWVNGDENTSITLGGKPTPSLRKLIANINRIAGIATKENLGAVRPDGITINIDDTGVIWCVAAALIQSGGGLNVDANGKLYVDFSQMPTDKFEALLKSLRLPIWLTKNTDFYVDINHANASDTLDEGRGLSATKPFKNIQNCVNYITDNYNVNRFNATIHIAAGDYRKDAAGVYLLSLPDYNKGTGSIILEAPMLASPTVITDCFDVYGAYIVKNLKFNPRFGYSGSSSIFTGIKLNQGANTTIYNVHMDFSNLSNSSFPRIDGIWANDGSKMLVASAPLDQLVGLFLKANTKIENIIRANTSVNIVFQADLTLEGNMSTDSAINCLKAATISFDTSGYPNPGRRGKIILASGASVTGKRYSVTENGILNTGSGGPEFIPGNTAGTTASGGQYI